MCYLITNLIDVNVISEYILIFDKLLVSEKMNAEVAVLLLFLFKTCLSDHGM